MNLFFKFYRDIPIRIVFRFAEGMLLWILIVPSGYAQTTNTKDSISTDQKWNFHFQNTIIYQYHPGFYAKYSGENSLLNAKEATTSITGTFYLGAKLWKGASIYYNPEISGGNGFSQTRGVAGFPNGEVYRVSDAAPKIYTARLYLHQIFALSDESQHITDDVNQLATKAPASYLSITAGKFSMMDFFDNNQYSHDPRTQFYNWALMGNGAWDYPANTKGYTYGIIAELVKPQWALRFAMVMVPVRANEAVMDSKFLRSHSEALEFEHKYSIGNQYGTIRLMTFLTEARMGNYQKAIAWGTAHNTAPVIDSVSALGRTKYGFGVNIEQNLSKNVGMFVRAGWNDGLNETWAFTEIDRCLSTGIQLGGKFWKRTDDNLGIALIANGLSTEHRDYLKGGGYGFIIGDGNLNYGSELIAEMYYSFKLPRYNFWLSPDYQFIINPAYNRDRGPVSAFGVRAHIAF
ncbi:MAG: carbohydrate porin [Bacteroidota bacterium]|nr:carbohydrate porin [Bacteroidota bacterium]